MLDCYYLGFERCFRDIYNNFIKILPKDIPIEETLKFNLKGKIFKSFLKAFISISATPFYV